MRLARFIYSLIFLFSGSILAQSELYEQANAAYEKADFKQAAIGYKKLEKDGWRSANLYYNLANAYYQLDELGKSILYYEKTLKLHPSFKDAKHNLQLAYLKSETQIEPLPSLFIVEWWQGLISKKTASGWAWHGVILVWIGVLFLMLYRWKKMTWSKFLGVVILMAGLAYTFLAWQKYNYDYRRQFAIIIAESVDLRENPNPESVGLFEAHEGLKVEVVDQVDEWFQVRLEDGVEAWVLKTDLEVI